jgi:DNA-binding CsgD family transcriptional regulator
MLRPQSREAIQILLVGSGSWDSGVLTWISPTWPKISHDRTGVPIRLWGYTGKLNKQVGGELGVAEKTVKVHRGRLMQKLGVTSVAELVQLVQKAGYLCRGE